MAGKISLVVLLSCVFHAFSSNQDVCTPKLEGSSLDVPGHDLHQDPAPQTSKVVNHAEHMVCCNADREKTMFMF